MATITVADLAGSLATDPRTCRKFLRSITPRDEQPGKGGRWAIEKRDVRSLKSKFQKYLIAQEEARLAREAKKVEDSTTDEVEEDATELDPTDAELEAIDAE